MTPDEYREVIRAMGLTPSKPSYDGATLHADKDGHFTSIPDPETLTADERPDVIEVIKARLGIDNH